MGYKEIILPVVGKCTWLSAVNLDEEKQTEAESRQDGGACCEGLWPGFGGVSTSSDGVILPLKDYVYSLGVHLDPALQMTAQIDATARSAYYQLPLLCQLCPFLELEDLKTVVVTSSLKFWNVLYIGLPLYLVWKLQLVQNMAARLVNVHLGVTALHQF